MPETTFPWFPVTFERPKHNFLAIVKGAHYDDDTATVWIEDEVQGHPYTVGTIELLDTNEMRWHSDLGEPLIVRPHPPRRRRTVGSLPPHPVADRDHRSDLDSRHAARLDRRRRRRNR